MAPQRKKKRAQRRILGPEVRARRIKAEQQLLPKLLIYHHVAKSHCRREKVIIKREMHKEKLQRQREERSNRIQERQQKKRALVEERRAAIKMKNHQQRLRRQQSRQRAKVLRAQRKLDRLATIMEAREEAKEKAKKKAHDQLMRLNVRKDKAAGRSKKRKNCDKAWIC